MAPLSAALSLSSPGSSEEQGIMSASLNLNQLRPIHFSNFSFIFSSNNYFLRETLLLYKFVTIFTFHFTIERGITLTDSLNHSMIGGLQKDTEALRTAWSRPHQRPGQCPPLCVSCCCMSGTLNLSVKKGAYHISYYAKVQRSLIKMHSRY